MIKKLTDQVDTFFKQYSKQGTDLLTNCNQNPDYALIVQILDEMSLHHVGVEPETCKMYFGKGKISYINVVDSPEFSIGVFCLSAGTSFKLHDHPDMLVVSKILMGSVKRKTLDMIDRTQQFTLPKKMYEENDFSVIGKKIDAFITSEGIYQAPCIMNLTPISGNIHSFEALEDTAILDVLIPNYDNVSRYCNYYEEVKGFEARDATSELETGYKLGEGSVVKIEDGSLNIKADSTQESAKRIVLSYCYPPTALKINVINLNDDENQLHDEVD